MKKYIRLSLNALFIAGILLLQGCVKDTCKKAYTYTYYLPVYKTTAEIRANIKSNAAKPIERPGKLYIRGQYIFLNEVDRGIHIIDNSNPSQPKNIAFVDIPGNMDIAVKGNTLYADLFTDLVAIDIANPQQVALKKIVEGVFPHRYYGNGFYADSTKVIAHWEARDTTIITSCDEELWWNGWANRGVFVADLAAGGAAKASSSPFGVGGSMARFAIVNERLYTVGNSELNVFNIATAHNPLFTNKKNIGWGIETIYPFQRKLFIGSTTGMFMYSISNPDHPSQIGQFNHVRSCDPVIADDEYAYVTLRSGNVCQGFANQMDVIKLNNFSNASLVKTYPMANPHGLSKDGGLLFICDGAEGLKVYKADDANNIQLIGRVTGIETYDVIADNNLALVVARDGLYQYDYSDPKNIRLLSKLGLSK